jgi:hypothetical protein
LKGGKATFVGSDTARMQLRRRHHPEGKPSHLHRTARTPFEIGPALERWLDRYHLSYPVFTLLAAPRRLFLKTPKYLFVRDAKHLGLELGLALNLTPRAPCLGLLFHGSHVLF